MPNTSPQYPSCFSLRHVLEGHDDIVGRIAWSPDGQKLASPSYDKTIRIWDSETGAPARLIKAHERFITGVTWSPDGRSLASSSDDRTVRIWDLKFRTTLRHTLPHDDIVTGVAWSPEGLAVASSCDDGRVRLWDAETGALKNRPGKHTDRVLSVAWSSDGKFLASASWDGTVRVWRGKTGKECLPPFDHDGEKVNHLAWSPNGRLIASACRKRIRIWDATTGDMLNILKGPSIFYSVSFSSDGAFLASKDLDGRIKLWRCCDWKSVANFRLSQSDWPYTCVAFHPNAQVLAALGEHDRNIYIFDLNFSGKPDKPSARCKKIFISYSHQDESWKDRVETHLGVLARQGLLDVWSDRRIEVGEDWFDKIKAEIDQADAAILLISANFLKSEFILNQEVTRLLKRREKEGMLIIPLIIKPCDWTAISWLSSIQARPKDGTPLSGGSDHDIDKALAALAGEVRALLHK